MRTFGPPNSALLVARSGAGPACAKRPLGESKQGRGLVTAHAVARTVAERKQVLGCDGGEHRRVDGAESLADGDLRDRRHPLRRAPHS